MFHGLEIFSAAISYAGCEKQVSFCQSARKTTLTMEEKEWGIEKVAFAKVKKKLKRNGFPLKVNQVPSTVPESKKYRGGA